MSLTSPEQVALGYPPDPPNDSGFDDFNAPQPNSLSIDTLLEAYELEASENPNSVAWLIRFHGLPEGVSAYNASKVFRVGDVPHMLVRTEGERADQEFSSKLAIYSCSEDGRDCYASQSVSNLAEITAGKIAQDPAIAYVKGNRIVTWVEVEPKDAADPTKGCDYKSVVAVGPALDKLVRKVESDNQIKGVRVVELIDGKIGFTTRTSKNGKFKMGFGVVNSLDELTKESLANAKEIKGLENLIVYDAAGNVQQWLGPNDMELLPNGDISLLYHIAWFENNGVEDNGVNDNREYCAAHCVLEIDPEDGSAQAKYSKIIARAKDTGVTTQQLPPKRPDLLEVMYPSGWLYGSDGKAYLLSGFRDAWMILQEIPDPLAEWWANNLAYANNPTIQPSDWPRAA